MKIATRPVVVLSQNNREFYLTMIQARELVRISYASVRNRDKEEGAIQRILNPRRIDSIKEFTLSGGDYPNCIILNWVGDTALQLTGRNIEIPIEDRVAQIIDGQHRVEGLRQALKEKPAIGKLEIPVVFYKGLSTQECANIFLSINTEQRPVQRSLVFDLYDVASDYVIDAAAHRARDIATTLNEREGSPFADLIRFPNEVKKRSAGVDLSTVVTSLKPLVEEKGIFEQVGVDELEMQISALLNFFSVLKEWYGAIWLDKDNAFLSSAGFSGAVEFFKTKMIYYCKSKESFEFATIEKAMDLDSEAVILRSHLKGLQGREAMRGVADMLLERFKPKVAKGLAKFKF